MITAKNRIESLSIASNMIGVRGASLLSDSLVSCTSLTTLDLSTNHIRSPGLKVVASVLIAQNKVLRRLILQDNLVCDGGNDLDGVVALQKALEINTALQMIDLRLNSISPLAARFL